MTKSPKNKKKQRSRSTSPQVNVPTQRTPIGLMQRTTRVVEAIATGVRQLMGSGSKATSGRRGKNQGSNATVQQGDASTIANTSSVNVPDSNNSGTNTTQECGAVDPNASLLSELGSRTPHFGTKTTNLFSPVTSQVATPAQNTATPGLNPK